MTYTIYSGDNSTDTIIDTTTSLRAARKLAHSRLNDLSGNAKAQIETNAGIIGKYSLTPSGRMQSLCPDDRWFVAA